MHIIRYILLIACLFGCSACDPGDAVTRYRVAKTSATPASDAPPAYEWELPDGWTSQPASAMRLASFHITSPSGTGDASLVRLSGSAGGIASNINRWRGQLDLEPQPEAALMEQTETRTGALGDFIYMKLTNPDNGKAILASIYQLDGAVLFAKASAPIDVADEQESAFLHFCENIRKP